MERIQDFPAQAADQIHNSYKEQLVKPSTKLRLALHGRWNVFLPILALGCALFVASPAAQAVDCTSATYYPSFSPTLPASISGNRDAQTPGVLVGSSALTAAQDVAHYTGNQCGGQYYKFRSIGTLVPGVTYAYGGRTHPVYETGIPGIGYALMAAVYSDNVTPISPWYAVTSDWTQIPSRAKSSLANVRVALVFTGSLATGTYKIASRQIAEVYEGKSAGDRTIPLTLYGVTINVTATGCSLTSSTQSDIALPQLLATRLASIGDVSDASGTTSLRVNCKQPTSVYVTLTDVVTPTNTGNVLSLAPDSGATGVGIQFFKQGSSTPLGFGPDSSQKGNTNQWLAGTLTGSSGGNLTIPLVAKYVKTEPKITPGSVKARASFTLSYQ
ncbi:fimbrial protein [Burkholderia sp. AU28863]|uniref:fimbrial protein n=1 Tax=Burkholderia sp. AU28863 TaxID=2015352 RepID=UPI0015C61F13|nr:fimbrial protein [Burkholderia sp. AU28863]